MAENGTVAARQDCGHPLSLIAQPSVPNRVDAAVDSVEPPGADPAADRLVSEPSRIELTHRDHTVLACGNCCHHGIRAVLDAFSTHTVDKASKTLDSPPVPEPSALFGAWS
jgi:hypothetical protein